MRESAVGLFEILACRLPRSGRGHYVRRLIRSRFRSWKKLSARCANYTGAAALMNGLPEVGWFLANRGYDADWFREGLIDKGTRPCIAGRKSRKTTIKYDKRRYKRRNRIERKFGRIKDWRRVATRYDRSPTAFLFAILLAETCMFCFGRLTPSYLGT
jgi:transposase